MKRILTRQDYLKDINSKHYSKYTGINEEVFANDANWGDTLVGRLINSLARKAKISFNQSRMSRLVKQLKEYFDMMLETGKFDITDSSVFTFIEISNIIGILKKQVEDGEEVSVLIQTTENLIIKVNSYDFDNKDEMIRLLKEFLEYLRGLKKDGASDDDSESGEESGDSNVIFLKYSKNFLQSVVDLHNMIKQNVVRFKEEEYGQKYNVGVQFDINSFNRLKNLFDKEKDPVKKLSILRQLVQMIEKGLDSFKTKNDKSNIDLFNKYFKEYAGLLSGMERENLQKSKDKKLQKKQSLPADKVDKSGSDISREVEKEKVRESLIYEEVEANLEKPETDAKNAWKKVVNAYNKSGISKFIPQIEEMLSIGSKDGKEKIKQSNKDIVAICKQVVLNKSTTGKPISFEELVKEAVNVNDMAKSISLFGRILLSFKEDMGLTGSYGSAIKPLKEFINKFSELEKLLPKLSKKNEMISNYSRFLLIRERNEFSDQIKNKFDELFTEDVIKYFEITEERRSEIESSVQEPEGYDFIFDSADYIIEIVRAFNRAYRIHTPGTIPSGRTNGKVSNKVFREYEYLGSGGGGSADNPGAGPYRNKELFTTWSEGVNDILSDTKYRPLFSDKAIFRFSQGGDNVEKGGKILMSFITRLLNDQEMYRGAVMSKFLNEYFGISEDFSDKKGLETRKNDSKKNSETADGIEIIKLKILPIDKTSLRKLERALDNNNKELKFKFKIKDGGEEKTYYSIFKEKRNNGDIICILTSKNFPFGNKISIEENRETPENPVFVNFRISVNQIKGKFLKFEDSRNISKAEDINWTFSNSDVGILCGDSKEPYLDEVDINSKFRDFKEQYEKIKSQI